MMGAANHTPGPWHVDEYHDHAIDIVYSLTKTVAKVTARPSLIDEARANARLIAAAPELLEAARLVIDWYESEDDHRKAGFYQRMDMCLNSEVALRAAIAKATGDAA